MENIPQDVLWHHCWKQSRTKTWEAESLWCQQRNGYMKCTPGPWYSAPGVLGSFVSLVWCTDFQTFYRDQRNSCHTMGDKTQQEAGFWASSPALLVSELSWWCYFFKLSDLIADSGLWYFQICQGHSALWMPQKPFQLGVLALINKKQTLILAISVFSIYHYPMCTHPDSSWPNGLCRSHI